MASNRIIADGNSAEQYVISDGEGVHLALAGDFGGGSVAVEQEVNGTFYPLLNEGVAITFTSAADVRLNVVTGDLLRLVTTGATAPAIDFNFAGASISR